MKYWDESKTIVEGCTPVSEGCWNCWSAGINHRFQDFENDLTVLTNSHWYPEIPVGYRVYSGEIRLREDRLPELRKGRKPKVIQIWNDLFHEKVSDDFIETTLEKSFESPHKILILTKRAKRLFDFYDAHNDQLYFFEGDESLWYGVTTENQQWADERIPYLLQVPGKRWLSVEPLLSPISFRWAKWETISRTKPTDHLDGLRHFHQIIVGCETGLHARPCKIEWVESIVEQCREAGVPCFVKAINLNGKITSDITKFPESVRVRELTWK